MLDLGGSTLKIGWSGAARPARVLPNCAVKHKRDTKWLVADQMMPEEVSVQHPHGRNNAPTKQIVHKITDYSGLYVRRPHDRGLVVNWELENQILARAFHRSVLDPTGSLSASAAASLLSECSLLATVPLLAPPTLVQDLDENLLEKWGLKSLRRITSAPLAHRAMMAEMYPSAAAAAASSSAAGASATPAAPAPVAAGNKESLHRLCSVVVDSGYSFTHVMPLYQGKVIKRASKRLNVGGKLLTNYLKETVSFRAWNMQDETWIINDVKEKLCYVSTDFEREIHAAKRSRKVADKIRREYVLPNGSTVIEGFVRTSTTPSVPGEQTLSLLNERFCIPEVLFNPSDVGLAQQGVVECIAAAIALCPAWMQPLMADNIVLVGGNAQMPNYAARIERELRPLLPSEFRIGVRTPAQPVTATWTGGSLLSATEKDTLQYATKADLAEWGSHGLTRRWEGDEDEDAVQAEGDDAAMHE